MLNDRPAGTLAASRPARSALALTLRGLGATLATASVIHPRLRGQITRSLVVEISTDDGVCRHWSFDGSTRRVHSHPGRAADPDHALRFDTSTRALRALLSPSPMERIVADLHEGRARVEGSTIVLSWFQGLTTALHPPRSPARRRPLPGAYLAPRADRFGGRVVVEPAIGLMDPSWVAAWRARAQLGIVRAAAGDLVGEP